MRTEYLLNQQMEHVLACLTEPNEIAMRVSLHTGLRIGDVLALRTEQLKPRFWVREQKTGKSKMVGLPAPLLARMNEIAGDTWVFEHRTDPKKHRTRQAVWADVKRAQRAFRLPENVGCHTARKVYAVELMQRYGDVLAVQRALNHSDVMVTLCYAMADRLVKKRLDKNRHIC